MKGRKKEPRILHAIKGTDRADRRNEAEPVTPARAPRRPAWLDGRSRGGRLWKDLAELLAEMRVMTPADEHALALLSDALAEYVELRAWVRRNGRTYESVWALGEDDDDADADGGVVMRKMRRPNPEVAMYQDAFKRVRSLLPEFGLTPSARARLKAAPEKVPDELRDFLGSKPGRTA